MSPDVRTKEDFDHHGWQQVIDWKGILKASFSWNPLIKYPGMENEYNREILL